MSAPSPPPEPEPKADAEDPAERPQIAIVGIGSSAGGLEALQEFFRNVPAETGIGFVVVVHQHPGHVSMLPELLGRETSLPVIQAADGTTIEPDHVYIGPSEGQLAVMNGTLQQMAVDDGRPSLPIDYFFRSLAEDQKENAIAMILSGTGTDGTVGLKAIKAESGMVMVQQPQSAKYAGMPSSAIATGLVDYVLPPADMPEQLTAYVSGSHLRDRKAAEPMPAFPEDALQKIFMLLRKETGHDFSDYKPNTLRRRIERRMNVHQIDAPNEYVRYLKENSNEIDLLFKELLISVTSFFRDPDAWEALRPFLKELIDSYPEEETLRCWVPGCATGEEAYSLAILLTELRKEADRPLDVQIFGTDLDTDAVEIARRGVFPKGIAVDVSPDRLARFFERDDESYRVKKEIREQIVFSPQNVISDPPFTRLDLISCRNVMIYLNAELQKKLLSIFHYALDSDGLLFMGPSETVSTFTGLFQPVDKRWKVYRRQETPASHPLPRLSSSAGVEHEQSGAPHRRAVSSQSARVPVVVERLLRDRFVPASVVVNDRGQIFYIHGRTGAYLEPAEGEPDHNILEMAREGLQIELSSALRECVSRKVQVSRENVRVKSNGGVSHVHLTVEMIHEPEAVRGLLLVSFRPVRLPPPELTDAEAPSAADEDGERIVHLERELRYLKESYRATQEELETSNEELQSTNEELQSTNEELQSSNEELETSKEEMESLNEELSTVNAELNAKVDELSHANDDMQNLLNSTQIGTLFLDNDLNIQRFTEQAKQVLSVRQTDEGRPISDLVTKLQETDLAADCRAVLDTLLPKEMDVQTTDGRHYLMRILPYRTTDNAIHGLVVTFVGIDRLIRAERNLEFFESIVQTIRHPLIVLDDNLQVIAVNDRFCQTFRVNRDKTEERKIYELGSGQWDIPELRELLENVLPENSAFKDYEVECNFPGIGRHRFVLNGRRLRRTGAFPPLILLGLEDAGKK